MTTAGKIALELFAPLPAPYEDAPLTWANLHEWLEEVEDVHAALSSHQPTQNKLMRAEELEERKAELRRQQQELLEGVTPDA